MKNKTLKFRIDWLDYSLDPYGKCRKTTVRAKSLSYALEMFYKKNPKARKPSVSLVE